MQPVLPSDRDRAVLRGFASRIDRADAGAHNNLGVLYYRKGMVDEAVDAFTRALELDPRMSIAERNLRIAYCDSGAFDQSVREWRERLAAQPNDSAARHRLARAYMLAGDFAAAAEELTALLAADDSNVDAMVELARAEQRRGRMDAASGWLQRALELRTEDPHLLFQYADIAYHRGLNGDALAALRLVVGRLPDHADAHFLLGFVLGDLGRHDEARDATRRAMQLNPSLGRAQSNLSLERADGAASAAAREEPTALPTGAPAHFNLGLAFRQKGYYEEALREYGLALEHGEDRLLVRQAMAEVHLLTGDTTAAVQLYDALVAEAPGSAKLWNERGVALHQSGRVDDARASYERAIAADPAYALARNNVGVAYFHAGRGDLACDAFREVLVREPSFIAARLNLALLLYRRQELPLCLQAFRQVLRLHPEHPVAWNGVGLVLAAMRSFEDARNAFGRAVDARPDYAEARYNLAFALSNLGDFAAALRETKRALELDPFYVPQKFELGIDLQYENPRVAVAPELGNDARPESTVNEFTFDLRALQSLFDELSPSTVVADRVGARDFAAARSALAAGEMERAAASVSAALAAGAPRVEGLLLQGDVFLRQGAYGEALERYRQARDLDPDGAAPLAGEVRALILLGRATHADVLAEQLAERARSDVDALLLVARVRADTNQTAAALAALDEARRQAPARADVLKQIGDVSRATGDDSRAFDCYRRAVALDPGFAAARVDLAALCAARGEAQAAERELEQAIATLPTYAEAALQLAALRRMSGRAEETIPLLVELLQRDPYHLDALVSLGESLFVADRRADAGVAFARVLRLDPDHVGALYFDGVLLGKQARFDEAIARWQRVIDLEPAGDFARRANRDLRTAMDLQVIFATHERRGAA